MKRLVHYPMIIWIACCPFVQACSSNDNPPPASASKAEALDAYTRKTEVVEKKTQPTLIKKKVAVAKSALSTTLPLQEQEVPLQKREDAVLSVETTTAEVAITHTATTPEIKSAPQQATELTETNEVKEAAESSVTPARYIAVKTNLAYQAALVNNLTFEIQCSKHVSVELPVIWSLSEFNEKHAIRTFALQPEARWWLSEAGQGHFIGLHAHVAWFNVKWKNNRYQDVERPLLGAGISYGYSLPLSKHWGAEFTLGAGYANIKYDTYYNIDNGALFSTDDSKNYWGITRVGLSLVYRFNSK